MKVLVKRSLSKLQKNKARNFIKINKKKTHFSKHQKATIQIKKLNFIKLKRKQFVIVKSNVFLLHPNLYENVKHCKQRIIIIIIKSKQIKIMLPKALTFK